MDEAERWLRDNDPSYDTYRKNRKNLSRLTGHYQTPFEEILMSPIADEEAEDGGWDSELENAINSRGLEYDRWFDQRAEYEKLPKRKRDRHKGSRAAYMREYRKRKREDAA